MHLLKKKNKENFDWSSLDDLEEQVNISEHNHKVDEFRSNAKNILLVSPFVAGGCYMMASSPNWEMKALGAGFVSWSLLLFFANRAPVLKEDKSPEDWHNYKNEITEKSPLEYISEIKNEITALKEQNESVPPAELVHKVRQLREPN